MSEYVSPSLGRKAFNCPHCNAFAHQNWYAGAAVSGLSSRRSVSLLRINYCAKCGYYSLWVGKQMVFPKKINVPLPNTDLPGDVKTDYLEAANILFDSPRGAAALMRLAIQKLVNSLGNPKFDLDKNIGLLVKNGLPTKVQKALDVVRVTGNHAVHPGTIDFNDNPETAHQLFKLVNIIGYNMITEPNEIDNIFDSSVSEKEKIHINKRDKSSA